MLFDEIKNKSKNELMGIILQQSEQLNRLSDMLTRAEKQRDGYAENCREMQEMLNQRQIRLEKCGSIAEASLEIQGLMQSAQTAADVYINNIRRLNKETEKKCAALSRESEIKAEETVNAASEKAVEIIADAERRADDIMKAASAEANEIMQRAERLLESAKADSEELRQAAVQFFIDREGENR